MEDKILIGLVAIGSLLTSINVMISNHQIRKLKEKIEGLERWHQFKAGYGNAINPSIHHTHVNYRNNDRSCN